MRPFEKLKRVGEVAYQLFALKPNLTAAHDVFYVSMLKKYIPNLFHKIDHKDLKIMHDMSYIDEPLKIFDPKETVFRAKNNLICKMSCRQIMDLKKLLGS